jgi:flavin-dependent dehydrogenase
MKTDVVVIGGGLAGSVSALHLVRAGLDVVLVDKRAFPRDKPCGEGLLPGGVEKLAALGLGDLVARVGGQPFEGILYRAHGARAVGDFAQGPRGEGRRGFGVRRLLLDDELQRGATAAGARLLTAACERLERTAEGVRAHLRGAEPVDARFVVGADGPRSRVRHELGLDLGAPRAGRYALRRHFRLAPGTPLPERVEVSALSGYELYMTPVQPGLIGIAALCERAVLQAGDGRPEARLSQLLEGAPDAVRARLEGAEPEGPVLACGPLRVRAREVFAERAVLVGDAAGYVDAITGEGMSLALRTAKLASDAVLAALERPADERRALRAYARARADIFRDHAWLTHGLVYLARHPALARRAIGRLGRDPALFGRLLAVNDGQRTLLSLGAWDLLRLGVGARPAPLSDGAAG